MFRRRKAHYKVWISFARWYFSLLLNGIKLSVQNLCIQADWLTVIRIRFVHEKIFWLVEPNIIIKTKQKKCMQWHVVRESDEDKTMVYYLNVLDPNERTVCEWVFAIMLHECVWVCAPVLFPYIVIVHTSHRGSYQSIQQGDVCVSWCCRSASVCRIRWAKCARVCMSFSVYDVFCVKWITHTDIHTRGYNTQFHAYTHVSSSGLCTTNKFIHTSSLRCECVNMW